MLNPFGSGTGIGHYNMLQADAGSYGYENCTEKTAWKKLLAERYQKAPDSFEKRLTEEYMQEQKIKVAKKDRAEADKAGWN